MRRHRAAQRRDVELPTGRQTAPKGARPQSSDQALLRQAARNTARWQADVAKARLYGGRTPGLRR